MPLFKADKVYDTSSNSLIIVKENLIVDFTSRQLRAFLLVAEHRSFTRAAEALFITPSALSIAIRELETQLGFRLFDRTTRHVVPTAYGNELLGVTRRNLKELDAAMCRLGKSATEAGRVLSIGATPLFAADVLPEAIKEFRGHHPDLRIRLFDGDRATIEPMVLSGKLDIGLGAFFRSAPGIRRTPLFRFSLMLIRPDDNPAFRRGSATWAALKGETSITLTPTSPLQQLIDKHLAKAGVVSYPSASLNFLNTQIALVEAGEGFAVIPSFGLPACRNRKVWVSRLVNPVVSLDFYQITNRGRKLPHGSEEFMSFLQNYIARWAGRAGIL
jgi:LysR family transcriptional regulator, carnitine catabolism transcriptional activator